MASSSLPAVVGHVSHSDAPVFIVVSASFVQLLPSISAGADGSSDMAFIFLEPVGDMLKVHGSIFHFYGLLYRNDVHSYASASWWDHLCYSSKGQEGHALEEHG